MLRSLLARPCPLLSHLRRHDCRPVARQLGRRADQIISRSYTSSEDETTDSDVDRPETRHRRQHLYVVLDDWKKGFSIHKLDLDDGSDGGDLTQRPPVHRQATGDRFWNFGAVGGKIIASGRVKSKEDNDYLTLVYDTEMEGLSIVPGLPPALHHHHGWALAIATGNRLYTFEQKSNFYGQYDGRMHLLEDAPPPADDKFGQAFWWVTSDHWSWSSIPTPLPFNVHAVESFAVHPKGEGHTLFVSVRRERGRVMDVQDDNIKHNKEDDTEDDIDDDTEEDKEDSLNTCVDRVSTTGSSIGASGTFSYDTGTGEWGRHGDWDLPFYGQAHYDAELDVWVGLHKRYDQYDHYATDGHICSCDVASLDGSFVQPAWKLSAEGLLDHYTRYPVAKLMSMGGSNYCLVEILPREGRHGNDDNKSVIRVSRFRIKYGKKGELLVTDRRPDRSYLFSGLYGLREARAFWM